MSRFVALLRGVNVGGRKLVMSELREVVETAGFGDVSTFIASGNLLLSCKLKQAGLEKKLEALIEAEFRLKTDVFARDLDALEAVIAANPFGVFAKGAPNFLVVHFMRGRASAEELAAMEMTALLGEEVRQGDNCLYIKFPKGQGASKLKTPKLGTARNWNTVTKLAALLAP